MEHQVMYSMNFEEHNREKAIENERRQKEKDKLQGVQVSTRANQYATKEDLKKAHKIALKSAKDRGAKLSPIQEEELVDGLD